MVERVLPGIPPALWALLWVAARELVPLADERGEGPWLSDAFAEIERRDRARTEV